MKYCVIKDTTRHICNGEVEETLIEIANSTKHNDGSFVKFEIITEEEYLSRLELEPKPIELPGTEERIRMLEDTINFLLGL